MLITMYTTYIKTIGKLNSDRKLYIIHNRFPIIHVIQPDFFFNIIRIFPPRLKTDPKIDTNKTTITISLNLVKVPDNCGFN